MGVVDENGRLFGAVNVIDLLVAAAVLGTLASGAVFVLTDDPEPPEERYLTVVIDDRPGDSITVLDSDAVAMPEGSVGLGRLDGHVTDTYVAPTGDDRYVSVARVRVNVSASAANRPTERRLVTDDETYLVGQPITLSEGEASYSGYVHAVGRSGSDLPVRTLNATVVARLPPAVADEIRAGDTQRVAGRQVVRVTAVDRQATTDGRPHVETTVSLRVLETDDGAVYGTQHVRPGAEVRVAPDGYEFTGTVTEVS
jgi:hypothetical protein